MLFGIYVALHAALTPGGDFQGGAILGSACVLGYSHAQLPGVWHPGPEEARDVLQALGAAAYGLVGVAVLAAGAAFLQNVLPLGKTGTLVSSGTIIVINMAVTVEVAAGFAVLVVDFTEETRRPPPGGDEENPST